MGCKAALEASDVPFGPFPSSGQVLLFLESGPSPTNAAGMIVCMNYYEKRRICHLACGLIIEQPARICGRTNISRRPRRERESRGTFARCRAFALDMYYDAALMRLERTEPTDSGDRHN
jgi:hypothetical protein